MKRSILAWQLRWAWHNFVTPEELELFVKEITEIIKSGQTIELVEWT